MSLNTIERRRDERYPFASQIEYSMRPYASGEGLKGVTIDISNLGLCMYALNPVDTGQEITIKTTLPVSWRSATVRWFEKIDNDFYKAGLSFVA